MPRSPSRATRRRTTVKKRGADNDNVAVEDNSADRKRRRTVHRSSTTATTTSRQNGTGDGEKPMTKVRSRTREHKKKLTLSLDDFLPKETGDVILTCGNGDVGQLGNGEETTKSKRPRKVERVDPPCKSFVQIAAGSFHTVVLSADHQVYTCGCNDDCALGRECYEDDGKKKRIDDQDFILRVVRFSRDQTELNGHVVQISAGDSHTAALTDKGSVFVWGTFRDTLGCLGVSLNGNKNEVVAKSVTPVLISSHADRHVVKIASGFNHLALLTSDGVIYTVGAGDVGQLGRLAPQFRNSSASHRTKKLMLTPNVAAPLKARGRIFFVNVWCAGYCCYARSADGSIYVWGLNNYWQLGLIPNDPSEVNVFYPTLSEEFKSDKKWTQFNGDHHILALNDQNEIYVIGRGTDSRLGTGNDLDQQKAVKLQDFDSIAGVTAGNAFSIAWKQQGSVYAWGYNQEENEMGLGLDDEEAVQKPRKLEAKSLENVKILQVAAGGQHTVMLGKTTRVVT